MNEDLQSCERLQTILERQRGLGSLPDAPSGVEVLAHKCQCTVEQERKPRKTSDTCTRSYLYNTHSHTQRVALYYNVKNKQTKKDMWNSSDTCTQ